MSSRRASVTGPRLWPWVVASVVWIAYIWGHSLVVGTLSTGESDFFMHLLSPAFEALGETDEEVMTFVIRKTAHFLEYAVLGMLLSKLRRVGAKRGADGLHVVEAGVLLACLVPVADETIQAFVPGRSSQLSDVWLDLLGVGFGTLLVLAVSHALRGNRR